MLNEVRRTLAHRLTAPIIPLLVRSKLTPNALTVLGFLLSLGAAGLLGMGYLFRGGFLVLFAGVFDLLDGALARATNRSSKFGALLDSTLDRLSEGALFFGLLIFYVRQASLHETLLIFIAFLGSFLVSYLRARGEGLGLRCEVGFFTRPERVLLLALGLLINQVLIILWVVAVLTYLTAGQRLLHLWKQTRE